MKIVAVERIIQSEKHVKPYSPDDSYMLSYREFVAYFANLKEITAHSFVIAAHFTYGWMPTILELKTQGGGFAQVASIVDDVKRGGLVTAEGFQALKNTINNSVVGSSKLLHFVDPSNYAIWDSRVYAYINGQLPHGYQIASIDNYLCYLDNCRAIVADARFGLVHASMSAKIGYAVTPLRAVELIMHERGPAEQAARTEGPDPD